MRRPLAMIFADAMIIAVPAATVEREPNVPVPIAICVGVAVVEADAVGCDAELVGKDLAERRRVALAVIVGADRERHRAGRVEANLGVLDQARIRGLDRARHAEPAQLAAAARLGAAGGEAGIVGEDQAILEVLAEVAAVVGVDQRRLVGHRLGRDHVAPAQLGAIDLELARGEIDHGLDHIGRLRPAGAAVGAGHHRVGQHRRRLGGDRRDHIGAGEHADVVGRRSGIAVGIVVGADVREVAHREGEEAAVRVERELGLGDVVAAMLVGLQTFAALGNPFHRPADEARRERSEHVFRIEPALHAEAAADILGDDAELGLRLLEHLRRDGAPDHVRALHGAAQRGAAVARGVFGDAAARLHGVGGEPVDHHAVTDHVRRGGERLRDRCPVAGDMGEGLVVRAALPHRDRAGHDRVLGGRDRGQHLVVDLDRFGRVLRLLQRLGDDEGDGIADIAHPLAGEERLRRGEGGAAVAPLARRLRALGAEPAHRLVLAGEHQQHAGHRPCGVGGDRHDAGMAVRRAQHIAAHLPGDRHVVDITAGAADQIRVLLARDRLADAEFTHVGLSALATSASARSPSFLVTSSCVTSS